MFWLGWQFTTGFHVEQRKANHFKFQTNRSDFGLSLLYIIVIVVAWMLKNTRTASVCIWIFNKVHGIWFGVIFFSADVSVCFFVHIHIQLRIGFHHCSGKTDIFDANDLQYLNLIFWLTCWTVWHQLELFFLFIFIWPKFFFFSKKDKQIKQSQTRAHPKMNVAKPHLGRDFQFKTNHRNTRHWSVIY